MAEKEGKSTGENICIDGGMTKLMIYHDDNGWKYEEKHKGVYPDMMFKDFAENWYELNVKNADCSKVNKENYKNYVYTHIIPYFKNYKLCDIQEDDCQRFLNQYVGGFKVKNDIA